MSSRPPRKMTKNSSVFWFSDILGILKGFAITVKDLEDALERGVGFDGSSIKGFVRFDECDMIAMPDTSTAYVDPFFKILTLTMMCNVLEPITRDYFSRAPQWVAQKAVVYLK